VRDIAEPRVQHDRGGADDGEHGRIRGHSPLSRLIEFEGLATGIDAKRALWLAAADPWER
jgi:hypothetical protein